MATSNNTFKFIETKGDLFSCPNTEALAHCISADVRMGKGIAVIFKQKFGGVEALKQQGQKPGGVAVLKRNNRFVYYLVTKEIARAKPTYKSLQSSLEAMKAHAVNHSVTAISMPRIGCGLDGLEWSKVATMLQDVYSDTNITVTVYTL